MGSPAPQQAAEPSRGPPPSDPAFGKAKIPDWLQDQWDDRRVLAVYRHQHIIEGHTGFRWLKVPAAVAPVFLNKPKHIRALGHILVLALMG